MSADKIKSANLLSKKEIICRGCHKKYMPVGLLRKNKFYCSIACHRTNSCYSIPQKIIGDALTNSGINFVGEKGWDWLRGPVSGRRLRVDFFIESLAIAIEYDGRQHYLRSAARSEEQFQGTRFRDEEKNKKLPENKIHLIRLRGWPENLAPLFLAIERAKNTQPAVEYIQLGDGYVHRRL